MDTTMSAFNMFNFDRIFVKVADKEGIAGIKSRAKSNSGLV